VRCRGDLWASGGICSLCEEDYSREINKGQNVAETCLNYMDVSWAYIDNQKCVRRYNPENICKVFQMENDFVELR
jgi:hypothetical protein